MKGHILLDQGLLAGKCGKQSIEICSKRRINGASWCPLKSLNPFKKASTKKIGTLKKALKKNRNPFKKAFKKEYGVQNPSNSLKEATLRGSTVSGREKRNFLKETMQYMSPSHFFPFKAFLRANIVRKRHVL